MKIKVIIEEIISQEFEVEVSDLNNAYDEIRAKYKNEEIILGNPTLTQANVMIQDEDGTFDHSDWNDLHV